MTLEKVTFNTILSEDTYILSTQYGRMTFHNYEEIKDMLRNIAKTSDLMLDTHETLRIKLEKLVDDEFVIAPAKLDLAVRALNSEGWHSFTLVDFTTGTTTTAKEYDL